MQFTQTPQPEPSTTPTGTPEPTDTPLPTATSTATETPEPTSTPTPELTATAAVEATQAADEMMAKINPALEMAGVSPEGGHLGWQQTEPVSIVLDTYGETVLTGFSEGLTSSDFVLSTTKTWESTSSLAGCGIMFRYHRKLAEGLFAFIAWHESGDTTCTFENTWVWMTK